MTNNPKSAVLYTGVTGNLARRVWQHKSKMIQGFTSRYNLTQLVYYERFFYPGAAIAREKEIKGWRRSKKIKLIESMNPRWEDLAIDWGNEFKPTPPASGARRSLGPLMKPRAFGMTPIRGTGSCLNNNFIGMQTNASALGRIALQPQPCDQRIRSCRTPSAVGASYPAGSNHSAARFLSRVSLRFLNLCTQAKS